LRSPASADSTWRRDTGERPNCAPTLFTTSSESLKSLADGCIETDTPFWVFVSMKYPGPEAMSA
jgi:hypothetical protein